MSNARKKPLILVSETHEPEAWGARDYGESEFESWLAVVQDLWGAGCFGPGQLDAMRQAANGLTMTKEKTIGAIGGAVGGLGTVAVELGAYIDVFDCDAAVLAFKRWDDGSAGAGKLLKLSPWDPPIPALQAKRYHGLIVAGALSLATSTAPLIKAIAGAVKDGGQLFVDALYAKDLSVGALVAQSIASPGQTLTLHTQAAVMDGLKKEGLELRSSAPADAQLIETIHKGLTRGQEIAQLLKAVPPPYRKQRLLAFTNELQRAAVLYQALERGLVTAVRTIHAKPRKL